MSTVEHQNRVTSRHWQRDCARELVGSLSRHRRHPSPAGAESRQGLLWI
ncbi:hypothetical protein ACGFIG_24000 [Micromonospora sp. NPDC049048]